MKLSPRGASSISLESLVAGEVTKTAICTIFGGAGVGKTTLACGAPNAVLLAAERGRGSLTTPTWYLDNYSDLMQAIGVLYNGGHGFQSVVIDSLDWLATVAIHPETCRVEGWSSLDQPYGKGSVAALEVWREYLDGINALRDQGMQVIQVCHSVVSRYESPMSDGYDRHVLALQSRASALIQEHSDVLGFLTWRVSVISKDAGFGRKITRGTGGGQRVLFTQERPAFLAKSRVELPDSIDIPTVKGASQSPETAWSALGQWLPQPV